MQGRLHANRMGEFFCYIFLSVVMGGVFSWIVVSRREKQCIRECKAMGNVLEMGQMGLAKISVGIFLGLYLLLLSWMISLWGTGVPGANAMIVLGCAGISLFWLLMIWRKCSLCPFVAIVDDSLVLWRYMGFVRPKKYPLGELTRSEYRDHFQKGSPHIIELYYKDKRIQEIDRDNCWSLYRRLEQLPQHDFRF